MDASCGCNQTAPRRPFFTTPFSGPILRIGDDKLADWLFIALRRKSADPLDRVLYDLDLLDQTRRKPHPLHYRLIGMLVADPTRALVFAERTLGRSISSANFGALVALILAHSISDPEIRAIFLNNAARDLSRAGFIQEALPIAEEAVAIHRELAGTHPGEFTAALVGSLNTLGAVLGELDRYEEASLIIEEGVVICRKLADATDLSMSLINFANLLSEQGGYTEALPIAQEAVAIRRELAGTYPGEFTAALANSLNTLRKRAFGARPRRSCIAGGEGGSKPLSRPCAHPTRRIRSRSRDVAPQFCVQVSPPPRRGSIRCGSRGDSPLR
jgi:tetratricopeptide (TPR) repeat protein